MPPLAVMLHLCTPRHKARDYGQTQQQRQICWRAGLPQQIAAIVTFWPNLGEMNAGWRRAHVALRARPD